MPDRSPFLPEITEGDIDWVCGLMRLNIDPPRREFLLAHDTCDVSACPGSGKTTLIIAKLAILAKKWPHRTKGICVLSHTNVAREEIQRRLGNTVVGQRLLVYPHFIDTIHGFVNRFLALPWLNSNGYPSPTIDNDVTTAYRRGVLGSEYRRLEVFLEKQRISFDRIRISARDLRFKIGGKDFPAGPHTTSFQLAEQAVQAGARAGYFCYDEMFVWAHALLEDFPDAASWLRHRFPLVIIDEMQDTSELQETLLHAVFPRTLPDIAVQRVGDQNQALFDDFDCDPENSDPFPDTQRHLAIPNSHRFGSAIASLASPFAVTPVGPGGLSGLGPTAIPGAPDDCPNAIFIFPGHSTAGVLDAYGKHVMTIFDDNALAQGVVTAVGAVHQDATEILPGSSHYPKSVPHYWGGYTADLCRKDPHPRHFIQYVLAAQAAVRSGRNLSPGVETIASGLIRLAGRIGDTGDFKRKARTHRALVEALTSNTRVLTAYRGLINDLLIGWIPLTLENWNAVCQTALVVAVALCEGSADQRAGYDFLKWSNDAAEPVAVSTSPSNIGPNVYRVEDGDRHVDIRLGSIHSVKGQTHLATLLLNTHWFDHSFTRMLPWLLGRKANGTGALVRDRKRLIQNYVAMTRPTHLICLAIPRFVFGDDEAWAGDVTILTDRGWSVIEIVDGVPLSLGATVADDGSRTSST